MIKNSYGFIIMCLVFRFLQGLGDAFAQTACKLAFISNLIGFSVVTSQFTEEREKYLGYTEASIGVGQMIGPVIGSLIYSGN